MWKKFVADYFNFTKRERVGIVTLIFCTLIFSILPYFYYLILPKKNYSYTQFEQEIAALQVKQLDSNSYRKKSFDENNYQNYYEPSKKNYAAKQQAKGELFEFDPNTLDETGWKKLGIRDKTISTILNFVSKGGKFYKPEDIAKIWGLREDDVERLVPFIKIDESKFKRFTANNSYTSNTYEKQKFTPSLIDINLADSTAFIALPGIGSKLSQRIITFREKLGGFYKIEQLGETFGLPDSVFIKIKPRLTLGINSIKTLNINKATLDELKTHPYIRFAMAKSIVEYRNQHGQFISINDLKKIMIITDEMFSKATPYLTIE